MSEERFPFIMPVRAPRKPVHWYECDRLSKPRVVKGRHGIVHYTLFRPRAVSVGMETHVHEKKGPGSGSLKSILHKQITVEDVPKNATIDAFVEAIMEGVQAIAEVTEDARYVYIYPIKERTRADSIGEKDARSFTASYSIFTRTR